MMLSLVQHWTNGLVDHGSHWSSHCAHLYICPDAAMSKTDTLKIFSGECVNIAALKQAIGI